MHDTRVQAYPPVEEADEIAWWLRIEVLLAQQQIADPIEACLRIDEKFRAAFPAFRIVKDFWMSSDFQAWCVRIRWGNGAPLTLEQDT